jgi:hypothetical protein
MVISQLPFHELQDHLQVCGVPGAQQHGRARLVDQHELASVPARAGRGFPMDLTERKLARVVEVAEQVWN